MARNISTDISIRWLLNRVFLLSKAFYECTHSLWFFIILYCNYVVNERSTLYSHEHNISFLLWIRTGSNRWPPECKSGALPAELRTHDLVPTLTLWWRFVLIGWVWARVDLNHRPHAYQACALTSWATGPWFFYFVNCTISSYSQNRGQKQYFLYQVVSLNISYEIVWYFMLYKYDIKLLFSRIAS